MEPNHLRSISHGLVIVAVMLGLIAAALWLRPESLESKAQGQVAYAASQADQGGIPDTAKQRLDMIEQLQALNKHLVDIEQGLRQGTFIVQTIQSVEVKPADKGSEP